MAHGGQHDVEAEIEVRLVAGRRGHRPLEQDREVGGLLHLDHEDPGTGGVRVAGGHEDAVAGPDGDLVEVSSIHAESCASTCRGELAGSTSSRPTPPTPPGRRPRSRARTRPRSCRSRSAGGRARTRGWGGRARAAADPRRAASPAGRCRRARAGAAAVPVQPTGIGGHDVGEQRPVRHPAAADVRLAGPMHGRGEPLLGPPRRGQRDPAKRGQPLAAAGRSGRSRSAASRPGAHAEPSPAMIADSVRFRPDPAAVRTEPAITACRSSSSRSARSWVKPLRTTMRSAAMSSRFFGNVYAGTSQPCSRSPAETSKTEKGAASTTNAADRVLRVGGVPEVGEHVHAPVLQVGRARVLVLVDHVLVERLGHQQPRLRLGPRRDERGQVEPRVAVEHQLVVDDLVGDVGVELAVRQPEPRDVHRQAGEDRVDREVRAGVRRRVRGGHDGTVGAHAKAGAAAARVATDSSVHGPVVTTPTWSMPSSANARQRSTNDAADSPGARRVEIVFSIAS